jgi:hypothetical protein
MAGADPGTAREEAERLVATAIGAASMAARRIGRTRGPVSSSPLGEALPAGLGTLADALVDTARSAFGIGHNQADYRVANGSPECCVCPVCRTIAAVRDPSPQAAERLATGAGDLAAGVASFLRAVAGAAGSVPRHPPASRETGPERPHADRPGPAAEQPRPGEPGPAWPAPEQPVSSGAVGDVWQAATRGPSAAPTPAPSGAGAPSPGPSGAGAPSPAAPARKPMAKKAVKPAARRAGSENEGDRPQGADPAGRGDEGR